MAAAVVLTAQIAAVSARKTLWKKIESNDVSIMSEEGSKSVNIVCIHLVQHRGTCPPM
jgi:hypothetical protein